MNYAKIIKDIIDKEFIKSVADELVDDTWRFFTDAQALQSFTDHYKIMVDDFDELKKIKSAYPKLGDSLKILKMDSNGTWPVCIETGGKNCNISIPIENPVLNISFFEGTTKTDGIEDYLGNQYGYWESNVWVHYYSGGEKVHTHVLSDTSIVNANIPIQLVNSSNEKLLFVRWYYDGDFEDFE